MSFGRQFRFSSRIGASLSLAAMVVAGLSVSALAFAKEPLEPAIGWDAGRVETGRSAALSGANMAVSNSIGALFANPANMAASRIYHIGAFASVWPEASRQTYGGAIVDSSTSSSSLTGGLAASYTQLDTNGLKRSGSDLRLGLAFPFSSKFRMGLAAKYLSYRQEGQGPLGTSAVSSGLDGEPIVRDFGIDAGLTLQPSPNFSAAIVGQNLNGRGHGFLPTLAGAAIGGGTDVFTLEADAMADFTTWNKTTLRMMGGGEVLIADKFPLRAGYMNDLGSKMQWLSAGAGYVERSMGLELAIRRSVSGPGATAIIASFTYHIESAGVGTSTSDNIY